MAVAIEVPAKTASNLDSSRFEALEKRVEALTLQLQALNILQSPPLNGRSLNHFGVPTPPLSAKPSKSSLVQASTTIQKPTQASPPATPMPVTPMPEQDGPALETPSAKKALQILEIIERYGTNVNSQFGVPWVGKAKFLPFVEDFVKAEKPVLMVLPAFPFKSPNRVDKAIGSLPDLGEELALTHLNGLCDSIEEIYAPGATVTIASDGIVYNDLMKVPDLEVWEYSSAIRDIIVKKGLKNVDTLRIVDLLKDHPVSGKLTKEEWLVHADCYRRELVARFMPRGFSSEEAIRNEKDVCLTYRGYIKFLTKDMKHSPLAAEGSGKRYKSAIELLARTMIARGKAFAAAIQEKCGNYVRLSIHETVGQAKLAVPLIPPPRGTTGPLMTPWHSSTVVGLDGSFRSAHAGDVRDTHDLIYRDGQPYFFRERSELWNLGLDVEFEHLYPCGLVIRPAANADPLSFRNVDMKKLRKLAELQSPVVLRGFTETTDRDLFIEKGHEVGTILPWKFGILQEVKDSGRRDSQGNNVVSNEAMPMHFDGMFKFLPKLDENGNEVKDENGEVIKVQSPPGFQFFTSVAAAPKGTGYTLFASARLFFHHLPQPYTVERLEAVRWGMDNDGFWDAKIHDIPLVVRHPVHNTPCLRWHQPWDRTKTKFSTCEVTIENDSQEIVNLVDTMTYDRRVCLRFTWEKGDILLSDNTAMLHTRTAFTDDCDRELWRIHFD